MEVPHWRFATGERRRRAALGAAGVRRLRLGHDGPNAAGGIVRSILGSSGYLPGWTARGNRGYSGYAWYRLKINVQDGRSLVAIKMPDNFDDAYQVYVNGQLIGQFGQFTARGVTTYNALPRAFPLPANFSGGPVTIAIRMWMAAYTPLVDQDAGGLHGPPVLGQAATISALLQLDWDAIDRFAAMANFSKWRYCCWRCWLAFGLFWLDRE